jgi:hypothetical protein
MNLDLAVIDNHNNDYNSFKNKEFFTINANELKKQYQEKCHRRSYIYNKILEKCYHKIKKASENDQSYLLFTVPEFIIGLPVYNLTYCAAYIIHNLKKNNYMTKFFNPNIIFINWSYDTPEYFEPEKTITFIEPIGSKQSKNTSYSYRPIDRTSTRILDFS